MLVVLTGSDQDHRLLQILSFVAVLARDWHEDCWLPIVVPKKHKKLSSSIHKQFPKMNMGHPLNKYNENEGTWIRNNNTGGIHWWILEGGGGKIYELWAQGPDKPINILLHTQTGTQLSVLIILSNNIIILMLSWLQYYWKNIYLQQDSLKPKYLGCFLVITDSSL